MTHTLLIGGIAVDTINTISPSFGYKGTIEFDETGTIEIEDWELHNSGGREKGRFMLVLPVISKELDSVLQRKIIGSFVFEYDEEDGPGSWIGCLKITQAPRRSLTVASKDEKFQFEVVGNCRRSATDAAHPFQPSSG